MSRQIIQYQHSTHVPNFVPTASWHYPYQQNHHDNGQTRQNMGRLGAGILAALSCMELWHWWRWTNMVEYLLWGWVLGAYSKPYFKPTHGHFIYTYVTDLIIFWIYFEDSLLFDPIRMQEWSIVRCLSSVSLHRHYSTMENMILCHPWVIVGTQGIDADLIFF